MSVSSLNRSDALVYVDSAMPSPSVHGLEKQYGSVVGADGVDLEVQEGELVGLLGPNGAGKSTLVKIACGLVRPTGGAAEIRAHPAGSPRPARARLPRRAVPLPGLVTADELLVLHQRLAGTAAARRAGGAPRLVGLRTRAIAASTRCPRGCSNGSGSPRR